MFSFQNRLDWSKPLLSQLDAIAPHYQKWVNSAVYRKCRLFKSPILESMTFTPWYLVPMFWMPIILYLGFMQCLEHVYCGGEWFVPIVYSNYSMSHDNFSLIFIYKPFSNSNYILRKEGKPNSKRGNGKYFKN